MKSRRLSTMSALAITLALVTGACGDDADDAAVSTTAVTDSATTEPASVDTARDGVAASDMAAPFMIIDFSRTTPCWCLPTPLHGYGHMSQPLRGTCPTALAAMTRRGLHAHAMTRAGSSKWAQPHPHGPPLASASQESSCVTRSVTRLPGIVTDEPTTQGGSDDYRNHGTGRRSRTRG